jgi:retron-type reverse transcriptase
LYLLAYGRIYRNAGAMTPGATDETVDGMSLAKKKRPLGIPSWSDKLLQEAIRLLLEASYDPQFNPASHGFRSKRGCHTALREVHHKWVGTKWFIEGDIAQCFDALDHQVLLSILREKIKDNRFLRLLEGLLRAGYLEDWRYNAILSGSPQGAVISPVLSNIYLDKLDQFIAESLLPRYTRKDYRAAIKLACARQST